MARNPPVRDVGNAYMLGVPKAVRMITVGRDDPYIIDKLFTKWNIEPFSLVVDIVAFAHRSMAAARYVQGLALGEPLDPSRIPFRPS